MTETERKALADRLRSKDGTLAGLIEAALKAADTLEAQAAEIERLREVLGDLIEQCWSCEKELTEEYYGTHYSGESLPLCNARAALGGNDE